MDDVSNFSDETNSSCHTLCRFISRNDREVVWGRRTYRLNRKIKYYKVRGKHARYCFWKGDRKVPKNYRILYNKYKFMYANKKSFCTSLGYFPWKYSKKRDLLIHAIPNDQIVSEDEMDVVEMKDVPETKYETNSEDENFDRYMLQQDLQELDWLNTNLMMRTENLIEHGTTEDLVNFLQDPISTTPTEIIDPNYIVE